MYDGSDRLPDKAVYGTHGELGRSAIPQSAMIEFTLRIVPPTTTHQSKGVSSIGGHPRMYDSAKLRDVKAVLDSLLVEHQPPEPLRGPVRLTIVYTFPWLKGHTNKFKKAGRRWKWTKPDLSNATKTFEDALVRMRFLEDDNQVAAQTTEKYWGHDVGIAVRLEPLWEHPVLGV